VHAGIVASRLGPFLTPDWADWVPEEKLERLRSLFAAEDGPAGRRPDPAAVPAIVEKTQAATAAPKRSLWQRFKDWVRSLIGERKGGAESSWFSAWLDEHLPGERFVEALLYLVLAAVVVATGWIVYTELRAAGLLDRWRGRRRAAPAAQPVVPAAPSLAGASEAEAPSILLTLLVGELRRLGRVQDRLSMTHRELGRAARFDAPADGETFERVLGAAERVRYASLPPAPGALRPVIEAGRSLLEALSRQARRAG
jgi:hypothetical protein